MAPFTFNQIMKIKALMEVADGIAKQTLRLEMEGWINLNDQQAPCQTAACIAGHALIYREQRKNPRLDFAKAAVVVSKKAAQANSENVFFHTQARKALGLTKDQARLLFVPTLWPHEFRLASTLAGSREARAHIARARILFFIATKGTDCIQPTP